MITIKTREPFLYLHLTLVYGIDFCNSQLFSKYITGEQLMC